MKKSRILMAVAILLLAVLLASCGASSLTANSGASYDYGYYDKPMMELVAETTSAAMGGVKFDSSYASSSDVMVDGSADYERKVISTCTIEAETKSFDSVIAEIEESVRARNGYIESSYVSGTGENRDGYRASRRANYTIRIPSSSMEAYIASVESIVNITSKSENARDISSTYYDIQARLESLEVQEERLLEMLKQSKDLEYLLKLEDKLSEVRYNIESLTSTLKGYDNKVDYATVTINLREVVEYTPPAEEPVSFGQRIGDAFAKSWNDFANGFKDFCVGLVYALPSLVVLAIIVTVVVVIIRNSIRKHRKNKQNSEK